MSSGGTDDYDDLLREVEASLSPTASPPVPRKSSTPTPKATQQGQEVEGTGGLAERLVGGAVAGAVAGGAVFVLFLLLPFVQSFSGAAGAFLATFVVWVLRGR